MVEEIHQAVDKLVVQVVVQLMAIVEEQEILLLLVQLKDLQVEIL